MTIQQAIDNIAAIKPHAFTDTQLCKWLEEIDRRIYLNVFLASHVTAGSVVYDYPECAEYELVVSAPHDSIYGYWLAAKIDFANGETDKAINSNAMYNTHFNDFVAWFCNTYHPATGYGYLEPEREVR